MTDVGNSSKPLIERRTLSSQLYEILEGKVISGQLAPGTRLSEESVAETFQVSRSPAREALLDLERAGLAERVGARDRMITIPTQETISAKYELWWIVDIGRTYLAALRATEQDLAELHRYLDRMARAVKGRDVKRYRAACDKWHQKIRRGCPNEYVNQVGGDCDLYLKWLEVLYDRSPDISEQTVAEHARILDAYERKDLGALSESIRVHITRQRDRILGLFGATGSAASLTPGAARAAD
ncbi:MAG TPA: GntR family transcriptional regulator [Burkholderiaceae bacterium]|nr:GntR family transcriptional regulator [Burkholderiaceae bacterium]